MIEQLTLHELEAVLKGVKPADLRGGETIAQYLHAASSACPPNATTCARTAMAFSNQERTFYDRHRLRRLPPLQVAAMIPRKGWLRRHLESGLILLAAWILGGRNVIRSPVVSRRDNNEMFEMDFQLRDIARRIRQQYKA